MYLFMVLFKFFIMVFLKFLSVLSLWVALPLNLPSHFPLIPTWQLIQQNVLFCFLIYLIWLVVLLIIGCLMSFLKFSIRVMTASQRENYIFCRVMRSSTKSITQIPGLKNWCFLYKVIVLHVFFFYHIRLHWLWHFFVLFRPWWRMCIQDNSLFFSNLESVYYLYCISRGLNLFKGLLCFKEVDFEKKILRIVISIFACSSMYCIWNPMVLITFFVFVGTSFCISMWKWYGKRNWWDLL